MNRRACLIAGVLTGCVTTTGGDRVTFDVRAGGAALADPATGSLTWTDEETGWTVTLTEAVAWIGPLYLWSDEPRLAPGGFGLRWTGLMPQAWAADQLAAGFLRGEMTWQAEVDLLAAPVALPPGQGIAGPSRSAELWLEPVYTDNDATTLRYAGLAERDGERLGFVGGMVIDEGQVLQADDNPALLRRVRGLLWDAELADGGLLTVTGDPRRWFDGAPFEALTDAPVDPTGAHIVQAQDPVGRTIYARARRIGDEGPWTFHWTPTEER